VSGVSRQSEWNPSAVVRGSAWRTLILRGSGLRTGVQPIEHDRRARRYPHQIGRRLPQPFARHRHVLGERCIKPRPKCLDCRFGIGTKLGIQPRCEGQGPPHGLGLAALRLRCCCPAWLGRCGRHRWSEAGLALSVAVFRNWRCCYLKRGRPFSPSATNWIGRSRRRQSWPVESAQVWSGFGREPVAGWTQPLAP
jgi:hypothetical protein